MTTHLSWQLGSVAAGILAMFAWSCSDGGTATTAATTSGGGAGGTTSGTGAGSSGSGAGSGTGTAGTGGTGGSSRGPAYEAGTADCPASDGVRRIKLVNNCTETRWFKMDGRTTPTWARSMDCPWAGTPCNAADGVAECTPIAKAAASAAGSDADPGIVYCKATGAGDEKTCACNPFFELGPGEQHEIELPDAAGFPSGTGWLATGCNAHGNGCAVGSDAAKNSTFELTYDPPGNGKLYYDISAVNAWTTASSVGMKSCGVDPDPADVFWCRGTGCRFDVNLQCPDGSDAFAPAPAGCIDCPTMIDGNGKKVLAGSCGTCPDGSSGNRIPAGTVFNASNVGGPEWTWSGSPNFAGGWGHDEGVHANRRFSCSGAGCSAAEPDKANTCLGGCDLCAVTQKVGAGDDECLKYCCPDGVHSYGGFEYHYDSAGCTALGVQAGTDYSPAVKGECPYVYTYGYEDHSSTFLCSTAASLLIQACPDAVDFPSSFEQ
jgi:hypothetical protein